MLARRPLVVAVAVPVPRCGAAGRHLHRLRVDVVGNLQSFAYSVWLHVRLRDFSFGFTQPRAKNFTLTNTKRHALRKLPLRGGSFFGKFKFGLFGGRVTVWKKILPSLPEGNLTIIFVYAVLKHLKEEDSRNL